jgi:hypothetical protein
MKYPFMFLFFSILVATFILVLVGSAAFAEIKELIAGKTGARHLPADWLSQSAYLNQETIMLKIFLTMDPETRRGLYDNEATLLGVFNSISEAEEKLGNMLNFCSIRAAT